MRKKERFVLGKRTFRSQKSKHFVLRIITDMLNKENIIHHVGVVKIQQNENLNNNEDEKDDGFDYCDYYYNR